MEGRKIVIKNTTVSKRLSKMFIHILLYFCAFISYIEAESGYIECYSGSLNVILSAPHGGYEEPNTIPDREAGCFNETTGECVWSHDCGTQSEDDCSVNIIRDAYTKEVTELLADNLENLTSKRPYVVINNLHRKKLDANREIGEAALGEAMAEEAFNEFHECIDNAKAAIEADECVGRTGLFLDIHGHGHPNNWAELGYLISGSNLDNNNFDSDDTSLSFLLSRSQLPLETVLRGTESFGHLLEEEGYTSVPSPTHSGPAGESYFSGGYNTKVHGSRDGGRIDAIQIESSRTNRELPERTEYAVALARTVVMFLEAHYSTNCNEESSTGSEVNESTSEESTDDPDDLDNEVSTTETSSDSSTMSVLYSTGLLLVSVIVALLL